MKTAAIYLRVSSEEQAEHGFSIANQRRECTDLAKKSGADQIFEFADEGVSASWLDRPGLSELRKAIQEQQIDLVVIYDPDRFARKLSHQLLVTEEIEKFSKLTFVNFEWTNTPEGKLFYSMRGAISEYEREKITIRTMSGRSQKARDGKLPFAIGPLGYKYDKKTQQICINQEELPIVNRIFDEYLSGRHGFNGIAWMLTREGVPTRRGAKVWYREVVRQIIRNPIYMGVYYANRNDMTGMVLNKYKPCGEKTLKRERSREEWIPVSVPAIVSPEDWLAAQDRMRERANRWARARSKYLLSGLLRCGLCGQSMNGRRTKNWGTPVVLYTCEKSLPGAHPGCGHRVRADEIERLIWERVVQWLQDPEALAEELQPSVDTSLVEAELNRQEKDLEKVRRSQREILKVLEQGLMPADDVLDSLNRLKRRESGLVQSMTELHRSLRQSTRFDQEALVEKASKWLNRLKDDLPIEERQQIVREFISGITVGHDTLSIKATPPSMVDGSKNQVEEALIALQMVTR